MLKSLSQMNICTGISIAVTSGGNSCSALTLSRSGLKLDLLKRIPATSNLSAVLADLPSAGIISLNLWGKSVLNKEVEGAVDLSGESFRKLMPGSDIGDFYVQKFSTGNRTFVSIVRRDDADVIIRQLTEKGFQVVMLSLGPFPVENVRDQLNSYGETLVFNGHDVQFDEGGAWLRYDYKDYRSGRFPIKIGAEQVEESLLLPYAAAFQALLNDRLEPIEADCPAVSQNMKAVLRSAKLKKNGVIVLIVSFLLLFANAMLFIYLNSENGRLQEEISRNATQTSDVDALNEKIKKAEELMRLTGVNKGPLKSAMLDQVSALLPAQITLTAVQLNPVIQHRTETQRTGLFADHHLAITGSCSSILPVYEWLARMRTLKWVTRAELTGYGTGTDEEKNVFRIDISF